MASTKKELTLMTELDRNQTILGDSTFLGTDMYNTHLNNNVLVFGTPGAGKTRSIVKPNLLQMNSSYVVTDPKGNLYREFAPMLRAHGYKVQKLDFTDPLHSSTWNPLRYVRDELDLDSLARAITKSETGYSQDPFWGNSAQLLLKAIMALAIEECRDEQRTATFFEVIGIADTWSYEKRGNWDVHNRLEEFFEEVDRGIGWDSNCNPYERTPKPDSLAYKTWLRFRSIAGVETTSSCIVMQLWSTLEKLAGKEKAFLLSDQDPISLQSIGAEKTALFVVVSDMDRTMDFLVSIFYSQLFKELCEYADKYCCSTGNRLPVPVRIILDDFANQTTIENFDVLIAAVRSRDIWLMPICQSVAQLTERYGESASTIIGCCDTQVYLGVNDIATARELSQRANIPVSDVQSMPVGEELVFTRGHAPKRVNSYNLEEHPNYQYLDERSKYQYSSRRRLAYSSRKQ